MAAIVGPFRLQGVRLVNLVVSLDCRVSGKTDINILVISLKFLYIPALLKHDLIHGEF